jgi:hypothetical protein
MARRKKKFKSEKRGVQRSADLILLTCYRCNMQRAIPHEGRNTDEVLDAEAVGWYNVLDGIALCPRHTIESGANLQPLKPLSEIIYGDPEARRESVRRYLERTRRRMERASWTSATSEDSMKSEIS